MLTVNGLTASTMRWFAPWSGVWVADLVLAADAVPSGRVAITSTEGLVLTGTIDPAHTGAFGERRRARVVAGGGGWAKDVRPQHYTSAVGLSLQELASTTAAEVGEVVTILVPKIVGLDFARIAGPASQIFVDAGVDWWVGTDGITRVGIRPPLPPPPSLQLNDWDAETGTMSFVADTLVEPGTVIVDVRFGRRVVRSVEATVSEGSVTGTLWVADAAPEPGSVTTELVEAFGALARVATRAELGRLYEYRVIGMAGDRVELQAEIRADGAPVDGVPDILPGSIWAGLSGYRAILRPSSRVLVGFIAGNARRPYVAAYEPPEGEGWRPLKLELDAIASVEIGAQAVGVLLGPADGADFVARATGILAGFAAVAVYAQALAKLLPVHEPAASALVAAIAPLALQIPSKKVLAS